MSDEKKPTAKELTIPQTLTKLRNYPPPRNERPNRIRANAKNPNWSFWKYMPEVETWQACALALNIDPDSLERPEQELFCPPSDGFLTKSFPSDEDANNFEKLLRLLHANRETQHFTHAHNVHDPVRLCEFAAWCAPVVRGLIGCDIPEELAVLAKVAPTVPDQVKQMLPAGMQVSKAPPPITPVRGGGYVARRAVEVQRKPATAPDWAYWPAARLVKPWQAVALSLNLEPESLEHSSMAWMAGPGVGPMLKSESFPDAETEAAFGKRLALLGDFVSHSSKAPLGVLAGKLVAHTMPPEMAAFIAVPAVTVASAETTDNLAPAKVEAVPGMQTETPKPWLIADPADPDPKYSWYTPARYFARQLVIHDSTLLTKRDLLADKVAQSLTNAGIKKRGNKLPFDRGTILKAFTNVSLG